VHEQTGALELARTLGHEEVVVAQDRASGLLAVIAVHDTSRGHAVGGTRMWSYPSLDAAMVDALRLSRAMTAKAIWADMAYGGGKAVIVGDPARDKTEARLLAYARAVERLGGRFETGCDVGIGGADIAVMRRATRYVSHTEPGSALDTADLAALGVAASIDAMAARLERTGPALHVAIQGVGQVGASLARQLAAQGVRLTLADVDQGRAQRLAAELGAAAVAADAIYDVPADVFSPNALGAVINDATVPRLRCRAVVGAANEQLREPRHGDALAARGILYAPDYVVNAGGLLSLLFERGLTDEAGVREKVRAIGPRVGELLGRAEAEGLAPHRLADRVVEETLERARLAQR
jgi:glutamate dehydrogenase/leucine dehydrogenase